MEYVAGVSGAVAALAALGALVFAYLTVREARASRRDFVLETQRERLEEMAGIVKHIGEISYMGGSLGLARLRLAAAINAAGLDLPACRKLVLELTNAGEAIEPATAALSEIANALRDLDPKLHSINVT